MLSDTPYSDLLQNKRAYEIMLLCDQGRSFAEIGKQYQISPGRVRSVYRHIKRRQADLYLHHISHTLGRENFPGIYDFRLALYRFYGNIIYVCAYLEKEYREILDDYRAGEPGMPPAFLEKVPPFRPELPEETMDAVAHLRDEKKASYIEIGAALGITPDKAKRLYDDFYHKKALALVGEHPEEFYAERRAQSGMNSRVKKTYDILLERKKQEALCPESENPHKLKPED